MSKIQKNKWYRVVIDGQEYVVRVDDNIMKYCVIDYYDARLWFTGSITACKKWVEERRLYHD
ncbi:MAG: hypothetical protein J6V11_03355 [Alphaproteobacteria bacterium]|nr:hypothetical protein [Alphaproteobacteria bacterium]